MTISIVTALPGWGKTLKLTEFGYKANLEGKTVWTNFDMFDMPYPDKVIKYNDPLEPLTEATNSLILMSEVGILLDQRKMHKIPDDVWDNFKQHRKDGNNIIADAQAMVDVAYTFRNLIQYQYHIYSRLRMFKQRKKNSSDYDRYALNLLLVRVFNPQPKGMDYGRRYWTYNPKYFKHYDTAYKLERNKSLFDVGQEVIQSPYIEEIEQDYKRLILY